MSFKWNAMKVKQQLVEAVLDLSIGQKRRKRSFACLDGGNQAAFKLAA